MPSADFRIEMGTTGSWDPFIGFSVNSGFAETGRETPLRTFDAFRLEGIASSGGFQNLTTRGLLIGGDYGNGVHGRGVWGLYGGYEYFAPGIFRVSSTNASFGTTAQSHLGAMTLEGTALVGAGYAAAQSVQEVDERTYHYGVAPQAVVALRVVGGRRAALDAGARGYFISDVGGFGFAGRDVILRADATLAVRIAGKHGVAVRSVWAERRATPAGLARLIQQESTFGIFYTFLGSGGFGGK
jgi:hypothetical protein